METSLTLSLLATLKCLTNICILFLRPDNPIKRFYTFIMYFQHERGDLFLHAVYNFSCINIYGRRDDGSQLESKHVAVNKLIKTGAVCG